MRLSWFILCAAACGSSNPPATSGPPASIVATRAAPDDVIVAQVDGRPVWGSCVVAQAARGATKPNALNQCIDFELMAQAAERRGLATSPEVARATHTAMVSQLVAQVYEAGYQKPADFGNNWARLTNSNLWRVKHEDYRASTYVRITLPETATQDQVDAAKVTADHIAEVLAPERGLLGPQLVELAQRAAGETKLDHQDVPAYRIGGFGDARYGNALFALPEIGRTTPATRTKWGWDIIAWTGDVPATDPTEDEIVEKLLPEVKQSFFATWVGRIERDLGVHVEMVPANIAKLEGKP